MQKPFGKLFYKLMRSKARELKGKPLEEKRKLISREVKQGMTAEMHVFKKTLAEHPEYRPQLIRAYARQLKAESSIFRQSIRKQLVEGLGREKAIPLIAQGLNSSNPEIQIETMNALAGLNAQKYILKIKKALNEKNALVRVAAINALNRLEDRTSNLKLRACLHDLEPAVRIAAINALAKLASEKESSWIKEWLKELLEDPEYPVKQVAFNALKKLGAAE